MGEKFLRNEIILSSLNFPTAKGYLIIKDGYDLKKIC